LEIAIESGKKRNLLKSFIANSESDILVLLKIKYVPRKLSPSSGFPLQKSGLHLFGVMTKISTLNLTKSRKQELSTSLKCWSTSHVPLTLKLTRPSLVTRNVFLARTV
jgi:hypothetical protein